MPGIFGAWKAPGTLDVGSLMEKMMHAMKREKITVDSFVDPVRGYCMGRASLGTLNRSAQPIASSECDSRLIFHGELYGASPAGSDPDYILHKYLESGDRCVDSLNGVFHFAVFDDREGTIKLFTDKFGLQPLYYSNRSGSFSFAGEIRALLADESMSKSPDYASFADFFHFGQILGHKTPLSEVRLVPPWIHADFRSEP